MRIGYVVTDFPPLSETFVRREVQALRDRGHRMFVYANRVHRDPRVAWDEEGIQVREFGSVAALIDAARHDGVEHFNGSLMFSAQRDAQAASRALRIPYTLRAYSGHDVFTAWDGVLYREASADSLCAAIIAEDPFVRDWLIARLGASADRIEMIPNSFDLDVYSLPEPRDGRERLVILAIARFVEKKGLVYLVQAFNQLCERRNSVELWLVGWGPEEARLRQAAARNSQVKLLGGIAEPDTRAAYAAADIFCLPCIQMANGDADGIPTTVLEAMAFQLPIISTDLLSLPFYVRNGEEGILTGPGDVGAIASALDLLCCEPDVRHRMGSAGLRRVSELCDIKKNAERLEGLFLAKRSSLWHEKLMALEGQRSAYTAEKEAYYTDCRVRAVDYFRPGGRFLDVGCDQGKFRFHLQKDVEYFGCDVLVNEAVRSAFPFVAAGAEALPYRDESFDCVLFYAVLIHVLDVDAALAEAHRVLKPGGFLYLQECVDDPNPIHLNHFANNDLRGRVSERFTFLRSTIVNGYLMLVVCQKTPAEDEVRPASALASVTVSNPTIRPVGSWRAEQPAIGSELPTATVCIATYNRERFIRRCIESVLSQTYPYVDIVVVDDGSTDGTRAILEEYGSAVRTAFHDRNLGRTVAKNRALVMASASSKYVSILDSDDYYEPLFVEKCVEFLERNPDVGVVYTDDILIDSAGREIARQAAINPWNVEVWLRTRNLRGDTWMARLDSVMKTALHDESLDLDEDYDLFYQLLEITQFGHLSEYLVYITQSSQHDRGYYLELARCHAANLVKYGYSPEYAYLRARRNPEWVPAIEAGIAIGKLLRDQRGRRANLLPDTQLSRPAARR